MVLDSDDMNARGQRVFPRRLGGGGVLPSSQPAGPVSVEGVSWLSVYGALVVFLVWGSQLFGATLIYRTGFEGHEGYQTNLSLTGQHGWVHEGTGGNGVVVEFIPGAGQSAYIGFGAPTGTDEFLNIWRPVNLAPVPTNLSVITFSVTMLIVDSSNGRRDDFRWSFYNTNANRLFTVDFDNVTEGINYALDNGAFVSTGFQFTRGAVHELTITLNFPRNRWQAALDGVALSGPVPITTTNAALNLGDVDAVWAVRTPGNPGNNYLVFDNYQLAGEPRITVYSPTRQPDGQLRLSVATEPVTRNVIEVSTNLFSWVGVMTNGTPAGRFDVLDNATMLMPRRFYRVRAVEP
jgi:hypothetical protein